MKPKSAEDILNEMPSGEALFASLAAELNLDLTSGGETNGNSNSDTKVDAGHSDAAPKPKRQRKKSEKSGDTASATPPDSGTPQPSSSELQPSGGEQPTPPSDDTGDAAGGEAVTANTDTEEGAVRPVGDSDAGGTGGSAGSVEQIKPVRTRTPRKSEQQTGTEQEPKLKPQERKKLKFSEWNGFAVNYLGRPMDKDGRLLTLPTRYNANMYEPFREKHGRMVMVVTRNAEGKVLSVEVFAEATDGTRDKMPTDGVMRNPYRMENRCRMYAHLFQLAYSKKKDWEEVVV